MDFQRIADSIAGMACIISVEKGKNKKYGDIRFVAANEVYIKSLEESLVGEYREGFEFIPNSLYTKYMLKNLTFEDSCYQCALGKKCFHSYAQIDRVDERVWLHSAFFPIRSDDENIGYCGIIIDFTDDPDASKMSSISADIAFSVLEMSMKIEQSSDFPGAMNNVIKDLRKLCGAKRCCIYLLDDEARTSSVLCEDISPDAAVQIPMKEIIDDHFYNVLLSWEDLIGGGSSLFIQNEDDMLLVKEKNPAWYENLVDNHVQTMALFSLRFGDDLLGYIWATNFDPERSEKIRETMEVACFILGSEIANYLLLNRLKVLSAKDFLTGVMNRNEMNRQVDAYSNGEIGAGRSVGVVFADLNGLKYVNDQEGHPAGDELLRNAARALCDVFDEEMIFRAGGDEFTMIIPGITEEELKAKVAELKEVMTRYNRVSFAVGAHRCEDCRDVRVALREADQKMYQDKEQFYLEHPEFMRRKAAMK